MRARALALGPLLVAPLLLAAGCGNGADEPGDGSDRGTSADVPAALIPSVTATSPTTGPPSSDPASGALPPEAAGCDPEGASPAAVAGELELRVRLGETLGAGPVRWVLTVANTGDETASLVYPTAQDGGVVLSKEGRERYRWAAASSFAQVVRCQTIAPGQQYRFELPGTSLDVPAGTYRLEASLAATPEPGLAVVSVTVVGPGTN